MRRLALIVAVAALCGCAVVPQNRRKRLADPMMQLQGAELERYQRTKLYESREAAAGGDGAPAGGGCGCQ